MQTAYKNEKTAESPSKELDGFPGNPDGTLPEVPLDQLEKGPGTKTRFTQLLAVIVAGVALFSDGYNIQVTGESNRRLC